MQQPSHLTDKLNNFFSVAENRVKGSHLNLIIASCVGKTDRRTFAEKGRLLLGRSSSRFVPFTALPLTRARFYERAAISGRRLISGWCWLFAVVTGVFSVRKCAQQLGFFFCYKLAQNNCNTNNCGANRNVQSLGCIEMFAEYFEFFVFFFWIAQLASSSSSRHSCSNNF